MKQRILLFLLATALGCNLLCSQDTASPTPEAVTRIEPAQTDPTPPGVPGENFTVPVPPIAPLAPVDGKVATPAPGFPFSSDNHGFTFNFDSDQEEKPGKTTVIQGFDWQHVLVPIVAIAFAFGTPILLVAFVLAYRMKKNRLLHQTIQNLVASGQPIPPELIASSGAKPIPTPNSDRRRGIILFSVGLGVIGFFLAVDGPWGIGFIPLAIGIGYFLTAQYAPRGVNGDKN